MATLLTHFKIYNSRNYSILLNVKMIEAKGESTTVEIILYYLTFSIFLFLVRIYNSRNYSILLNKNKESGNIVSTTVEIILYYLTLIC